MAEQFRDAIDDKKVTKNLLQLIRWKNKSGEMKELRLYEVLASVWCDVSDFLNLEGHTRKNIETKHRGDSKQCIRDVIEKWSNDEKPTYDYTWSGICKMLKNLELSGTSLLLKEALTADISSFNKDSDSKNVAFYLGTESRLFEDLLQKSCSLLKLISLVNEKQLKLSLFEIGGDESKLPVSRKPTNTEGNTDDTDGASAATAPEEPSVTYEDLSDEIKESEPKSKIHGVNYGNFCERVKFVLWTANDNEYYVATTYIKAPDVEGSHGDANKATRIGDGAVYVGMLAGQCVALLNTKQGHKSTEAIKKHLELFRNAKFLVSVGICYGFPQQGVKLGDVIVSNVIADHVSARINEDSQTPRSNKIEEMNSDITDIFCSSLNTVDKIQVAKDCKEQSGEIKQRYSQFKKGLVVSSFNLIDNKKFRDQVYHAYEQHPLAGEMEGGILLTLQNDNRSVIIIKGVTDFADGAKNKVWQVMGAVAAFHFLKYQLSQI